MKPIHAIIGGIVIVGLLAIPLVRNVMAPLDPPIDINVYNQIQYSTTYPEIADFIGREGTKVNMSVEDAMALRNIEGRLIGNMANENFEVYAWANTRGTARGDDPRMYLFFANGRLVAKTQRGLN